MRFALCVVFCIVSIGVESQNRSGIITSRSYCKAECFIGMSEADRIMYTTGLMDGFYASPYFGGEDRLAENLSRCTKQMDTRQIAAIITKYVQDHPEYWHLALSAEAWNALSQACPGALIPERLRNGKH